MSDFELFIQQQLDNFRTDHNPATQGQVTDTTLRAFIAQLEYERQKLLAKNAGSVQKAAERGYNA